jgi:glyoxylase-like metal-dependent hydrolase (beta-lactamase superfamily II)
MIKSVEMIGRKKAKTLLARGSIDSPLPGADADGLRASLAFLGDSLPGDSVTVYPGHGRSCGLGEALAAAHAEATQ